MDADSSIAALVFNATDITRPPNGSSQPTRNRRKKKREKNKKGGKAGNQGNFHGERQAFMDEHFPRYADVKGKGRRLMSDYFIALFKAYWAKFPWYLPFNKDLDQLHLYPLPEPSDETTERKGKVIDQTEQRIKSHLSYRFTAIGVKENNPWRPLLSALARRAQKLPAPRCMAPWQLYMSKKSEDINSTFDARWPAANLPVKDSLAFRSAIARELLAVEPEEYHKALEAETVRIHAEEMAEYEANNLPAAEDGDDDSFNRAREDLAAVVQPLLELIQEYTGLYCTLIAGVALPPGPQEFFLKVVTSGQTACAVPLPWHMYEQEAFGRDVMRSFARFLMKTPEYLQRMHAGGTLDTGISTNTAASPATAQLSALGLTISPARSRAASPLGTGRDAPTKPSRKARGKRVARQKKADDEDSAVESDSNMSGSDETSESEEGDEDEDEEEEEGEGVSEMDDDELEAELNLNGAGDKPRAPTPTLEELGFGDAMAAKLNKMSAKRRRIMLFLWARSTDWEREAEDRRTRNAAMMADLMGDAGGFLEKPKKTKKKKKSKDAVPEGPPRRSGRLRQGQEHAGTLPSTQPATAIPATSTPSSSGVVPLEATKSATTATTPLSTSAPAPTTTVSVASAHATPEPAIEELNMLEIATATPVRSVFTGTTPVSTSLAVAEIAAMKSTAMEATATDLSAASLAAATNPTASCAVTAADQVATTNLVVTTAISAVATNLAASPSAGSAPAALTSTVDAASQSTTPGASATLTLAASTATASPTARTTTSAPGSAPSASTPNVAVDMSGWPVWLKEAFKRLDQEEYGEEFRRAVAWWTVFERRHNWETTSKGLPTDGRPVEVAEWLRFGRKLGKNPAITDEVTYARRWSAWWGSLQPDWRQDGAGGCVRTGDGAWGCLDHPGKNGVFIALISLMWWKENAAATLKECQEAVEDIGWVIWRMSTSSTISQKRPAESQDVAPSKVKKPRRR